MARIRTIKPGFFTSEDVAALSIRARLTWIGLWTYADDAGRGKANTRLIKAALWPLDDEVDLQAIRDDLDELDAAGRITLYQVDGVEYLEVTAWTVHQRIDRPGKLAIPPNPDSVDEPPPTPDGPSSHVRRTFVEPAPNAHARKGKGEGREEGTRANTARPAPRCDRHLITPTTDPCRACGDARRAHDAWAPPTPTPPALADLEAEPRCDEHGDIARLCPLCRHARRNTA